MVEEDAASSETALRLYSELRDFVSSLVAEIGALLVASEPVSVVAAAAKALVGIIETVIAAMSAPRQALLPTVLSLRSTALSLCIEPLFYRSVIGCCSPFLLHPDGQWSCASHMIGNCHRTHVAYRKKLKAVNKNTRNYHWLTCQFNCRLPVTQERRLFCLERLALFGIRFVGQAGQLGVCWRGPSTQRKGRA